MPKKQRRLALKSALTDKVNNGNLIILDELVMGAPKTKEMAAVMAAINAPKALLVIGEIDENVIKSARNLAGITPVDATGINVYMILAHQKMVITKEALTIVEEVLLDA